MVLSLNSGICIMETSLKFSLIGVAIAAIGISGIIKMVSASLNTSSMVLTQ